MTGDLVDLPALGPDGEYRTRNREVIKDTAGRAGRGIIDRAKAFRAQVDRRAAQGCDRCLPRSVRPR